MRSKAHILVVDDNRSLVRAIEGVLLNSGYDVFTAFGGAEALQKAQEERPDLIVLDIVMPGMGGYTVCRHLQEEPDTAGIPVLMLTRRGNVDESKSILWRGRSFPVGLKDRMDAYDAGALNLLTKPVTAEVLLKEIEGVLWFGGL